ncbi:iron-containing alcohol dehydrogenase family protein [Celerinatantimonas sp. YJH-8]|uniref:iron-containing alcohol dehydrogenase family protein n=1 Tax=Celerinatantimonas sp. YJH-8 TaxID=3228714 RepID=UPI0038C388B7
MESTLAPSSITAHFPAGYIREAGIIQKLPQYCQKFGSKIMVLGGKTALSVLAEHVAPMPNTTYHWFGGACTQSHIDRLTQQATDEQADVLVAVGGGKALDTGKAVAVATGLPLITVPTIIATCAAVTPLTIRYLDDGHFSDLYHLPKAPELALVDTQILAESPLRWLSAGLGDTLAKWYEYRSLKHEPADLMGAPQLTSFNSELCFRLINTYGKKACAALDARQSDLALEQVTDAIVLYAGMTSILASGAHATAAHGLYEGFTVNDEVREFGHGLLVGYGNLVLLALEQRSDTELLDAIALAKVCGIPTQLAMIKNDWTEQEWNAVLREAIDTPDMQQLPFPVSVEMLSDACRRVDALAQSN